MRAHRWWISVLVGAFLVAAAGWAGPPAGAARTGPTATAQRILIDAASGGRTFDGIGALSAGASSRLLIDYPEPQRRQILDYLFKPGYGAALQILKVEIGGDTNSTDGAEPSHMRDPSDLNCDRGYEWWLMEQAKARNPGIRLSALQWGAPAWTGSGEARPTVWTDRDIDYLLSWLGCARRHGLRVDYLGGWNEAWFDTAWYQRLHAALTEHGYGDVKVVADDSFNWDVIEPLTRDAGFRSAVDVVGQHYVCGYLSDYLRCPSPQAARDLGKPLQASEQGSLPYDSGAAPLARALNRPYIDGAMTSTINWSLIASWYDTMPFQAAGLMGANEPWSGAYVAGASVWAVAHTTQFTRPGWRYVDSASGHLEGGGSHVALRSPDSRDYSAVLETIDATAPQDVVIDVGGGLPAGPLRVWTSDLSSSDSRRWFTPAGSVRPGETLTLEPGRVYTLTTTRGQGKGHAVSPPPRPLRLPYRDDFDSYAVGATPRYLSDLDGAFEVAPCTGRPGRCLRQAIGAQPVWWNGWLKRPVTVIGDLKSWRDYTAQVDVRLDEDGWTELLGRVDGQWGDAVSGVHLRLSSDGRWQLYDENLQGQDSALCAPSDPSCAGVSAPRARPVERRTLAAGRVGAPVEGRHRLGLRFAGDHITALLDGGPIAEVDSQVHASGQVGLAVSPWRHAEFDDLAVTPVRRPGNVRYLPAQELSATGTSFHHGYEPRDAVDGSAQSMWHSEWSPRSSLPQSITVDTGRPRPLAKVTYQPREDGNGNGVITRYELATSLDGVTFTPVASGSWPLDTTRKEIDLPGGPARYVRLTALAAGGGYASAAEIQVAVRTG
ncbi:discoidin domain-containing protein [Actinoallomurus sp. NPDC052308]|uniref:discoidin domain-containing protein n=1 Tax=Actinoallomurus sp. NPDC052308 TaxID=3155530 RepID=UPI00343C0E8A